MLVLVLLGIVWVVVLAPMVLRKLREREILTSVTSFSGHLSTLSVGSSSRSGAGGSVPGAAIGFSAAGRRLAEQHGLVTLGDAGSLRFGTRNGAHAPATADVGPLVSHATTIRRRRVVALLLLGLVLSLGLGLAVAAFFYLAVACVVTLVAYFGLLAYFHQLAIERAQKVVALETRRGVAMALDEARHVRAGIAPVAKPRVGGSGWSVPEEDLEGLDLEHEQLVTASR